MADEAAAAHLPIDDPLAQKAKTAVHDGDTATLRQLLHDHLALATVRIGRIGESRTLLHVATDWPGHYPNVAETISILADAGADVDAPFEGGHRETPLHWAASSNDVAAVDALLDAGAHIEATGSVLGGGAPLADACGFGQWDAARRLVERGAKPRLRDAAALGMMDFIEEHFATNRPDAEDITQSLWSACNGSQRDAARYLIERGGQLNWVGWGDQTCLDLALANEDVAFADWLRERGAQHARDLKLI